MKMMVVVSMELVVLALLLAGCKTGHLYSASPTGTPAVLVEPSYRAWLKPGSTVADADRAKGECAEERRNNKQLLKESLTVRSDAYEACMNRKGFSYYKKR